MQRKWSFSEEQKRRFQQLLDKEGEAARGGEKLSSKETTEMFRLAVLSAKDIEGAEISQDTVDGFLGTVDLSRGRRSIKSPPEMKENNTQAESAQMPQTKEEGGHMAKQVGSHTEESEGLSTKRPAIGGVLSIIAGVIELMIGFASSFAISGNPVGWFMALLGIVAIVGGVFAIKRRLWGFALAGAICSLVTLLLGIPAVILIVLSKAEFK